MISNAPIGSYAVTLESIPDHVSAQAVFATATNIRDGTTSTASLNLEQTRSLLDHAYGEKSIVDDFMDRLTSHETLELQSTGRDPCIFTSRELSQFGFSADDLEL